MTYQLVFTTDRGEWHQMTAERSAPAGIEVSMLRTPDRETLHTELARADFWISERAGSITAEMIRQAPSLKLIQRLGSQYHDIDLQAARDAGVAVCYLPIHGVILVAEHAVMQMLAVAKKIREAERILLEASPQWGKSQPTDEDTFHYNWSGMNGVRQLWKKTVGILGFGEIGLELARLLQGWECQVLYYKRNKLPAHVESQLAVEYQKSEAIFPQADYLVNLLPYSPATKNYFNDQVLSQFKPGSILISCGSGGTIDEQALVDAIRSEKLAGAALDTFTEEPLPADSLLIRAAQEGANLLLTPHIAAGTRDWTGELPDRRGDYRNIIHFINKEPLEYQLV